MIQALGGLSKYSKIDVKESEGWIGSKSLKQKPSYSMIMSKVHHPRPKAEKFQRFCPGQFTFQGKKILLISFHGDSKLDKNETDPRFAGNDKPTRLRQYLTHFQELRTSTKSDHLIIGGDFNRDLDKPEFSGIFTKFNLQIVPYKHQRKKKVDALICDNGLSKDITVTVYIKEEKKDKVGNILKKDGDTFLEHFKFSKNSLDHDPLLFTIKIKVPTTEVQLPTTEVQVPTKEVQLPTTDEDVLAEALRTQMNLESQETAETDPTNQNPKANLEASGSSLEETSSGTIPKSTQKK
jgi:hypothetical protein